jgi:Tetratricopeptide repeat
MHPAHSSRSQITVRTTRAAVCLIWERPSVNVRQRPVMNLPIVTQLTARVLGGLGAARLNLGNVAAARTLLEESLAVNRRYHDRWSLAISLTVLGHVSLADSDHTRAQALLTEAASQFADTGNLMFVPWCLEGLAGAAAARGDNERAAELDGARDALRAQIGVLHPPLHPAPPTRECLPPFAPA